MKGRGVVITGCDTGFGHQLAKRLHGFEFTVFACCLNDSSDGALTLKKLGAETGRLHVIKMDVTNQKEVDAARDYVERNLPELGLWGVVNNAGFAYVGYIEWLPVENYEKVHSFINF
jgi:3-hydroxybutyrate dehydrogenase